MEPEKKPKVGRPTKYQGPATIAKVEAVVGQLRDSPQNFLSCCGMEQLADHLDVSRDTLYEWAKQHEEFSDAIKRWLTARNSAFYKTAKALAPAIWIFMAKNWLGMRDRSIVEVPGLEQTLRFNFAEPEVPKMTIEVVNTDGNLPAAPVVRQLAPAKVASDMTDAELEAEIARLLREKNGKS